MVLVLNFDKRTEVNVASTKLTSHDIAKPFYGPPSSMRQIGELAPLPILGNGIA